MGIILAKFRKEKTTIQILEELEAKIKNIEGFSISTQARQKRFVGNFLVFSVGLYVIASIVFYFAFFPSTWSKRTIYSTPLLLFPILIILLKRLVAWFFQRKLNRNASQLKTLRAEKKKLIEQVMDKETYKVALEIINRFGDASARSQHQLIANPNTSIAPSPAASNLMTPQKFQATKIGQTPQTQIRHQPQQIASRINQQYTSPRVSQQSIQRYNIVQQATHPHQTTPFPIINQSQKGLFEKVVDYLINDGPSSRYGMICKECFGHNGMVSQEEYEYSAFKCAFCKALNPAKKLRPIAPRLPLPSKATEEAINSKPIQSQIQSASANVSEKDSGSETEPVSNVIESKNSNEKPTIESNDMEIEETTVEDQESAEPSPPISQSTVDSETTTTTTTTTDEPVEKSSSDKKNE